ncbi:ATP-binding protein [Paenibacillus durus]|uniref:ATP-binding protein n=1 Tax=Paenibacillus durus TaxID=44251 RepID=UPI0006940D8A|nr:ATP-binding protein [Paenibacillus durus]
MEIVTIEDWKKFRNLETLPQKAGVSPNQLAKLVAKELADNALDHCGQCEVGLLEPNGFYVKDNGNGIDPELLPDLFSINRSFMSSKILRMPTRGALGNGLRVVAGSVIASGGSMFVSIRGKKYQIQFQPNGTSSVEVIGDYSDNGTLIEIQFGKSLTPNLEWAESAIHYNRGDEYKGKSSGYWYTSEAFYELCQGYSGSVRDLVSEFDGCTGAKAGKVSSDYKGQRANSLTFEDAEKLLGTIRISSRQVNPDRFGGIGELDDYGYYKSEGAFTVSSGKGQVAAQIPFTVEAWVDYDTRVGLDFLINKSPTTGQMNLYRGKKELTLSGCGLYEDIKMKHANIVVNIITPYMPIVSDGKEPDLKPMKVEIVDAIKKAANRANKFTAKLEKKPSQKNVILDNLQAAIDKSSGNGRFPFSLRQLYYAIRPYVITELGKQLEYNNFTTVITNYENEQGDIAGLYRDNRGVLYHPHTGQEIPIGTLTVKEYKRPEWTFNKILYCEKEGLFPLLKQAQFPERFDCALVTSKGYASRAVKDLLDMLGDTDEELQFFCIHDADAAGTKIYETLVEETKARPGRKVNVINLGLDPEEAVAMGLEIEELEAKKDEKPVAAYVPEKWKRWLQTNRIELNAMASDQFVSWLEGKMETYDQGKLVPDTNTLKQKMELTVRRRLELEIRERILREARYEKQVQEQMQFLIPALHERYDTLADEVSNVLNNQRELFWTNVVEHIGNDIQL